MGVLRYLRAVCKEKKSVNIFYQWCSVLCHREFEGMELYDVKLWVKVITEFPETEYFPTNNPFSQNGKKI